MENLVEYLAKSLVEKPEDVRISRVSKGDEIVIELRVNPDDMGKVIGKQGRIAKSIRTVVKAAAAKEGKHVRYSVDILE